MQRVGVCRMLVTTSFQLGSFARPPSSAPREANAGLPQPASPAPRRDAAGADDGSAHFSMISTISPGSLAAAYHSLRSREAEASGLAPAADPAVLSGQGIPAALAAYGEVLGDD